MLWDVRRWGGEGGGISLCPPAETTTTNPKLAVVLEDGNQVLKCVAYCDCSCTGAPIREQQLLLTLFPSYGAERPSRCSPQGAAAVSQLGLHSSAKELYELHCCIVLQQN